MAEEAPPSLLKASNSINNKTDGEATIRTITMRQLTTENKREAMVTRADTTSHTSRREMK